MHQERFISAQLQVERSDGYKDMFLMASILLIVSTVFGSSVSVIIRHLKNVPVASLMSSREIVLVIFSYLFILIGDIQIYAPTLTEKLKLLLFSKHPKQVRVCLAST